MRKIKVSVAQLIPKLGDKTFNLRLMQKSIIEAHANESDLIVFPELFLTGYSVENEVEQLAETENGPFLNQIKQLCQQYAIYAIFGFPERGDDDHYYISSALIDSNGDLRGIYRKTHLFDKEKHTFTPGEEFKVISTPLGNIGLMICFDIEFPEIARALKLKGADLIAVVNANMEPYGHYHYIYAKARAMENEIPVVVCNRLGKEGELNFCGGSMVIDAQGHERLHMYQSVDIQTVELPLTINSDPKLTYIANRRSSLYSILTT